MDTRECLLKEIMALDFTLYDLALYLDTHPCDEKALCLFKELMEKVDPLRQKYEECFGPLTMANAATECKWRWIENPWPWERMV
jgi:spore coat protein JB